MKKNLQQGFTLIELLVVIAIIGILASVVLASLNSARNKGADAAIKANLANIRPQAEIFYDTAGDYGSAALACTVTAAGVVGGTGCPGTVGDSLMADATWQQGVKAAAKAAGSTALMNVSAPGGTQGWAVWVATKNPGITDGGWCVDSTGKAMERLTIGSATAC